MSRNLHCSLKTYSLQRTVLFVQDNYDVDSPEGRESRAWSLRAASHCLLSVFISGCTRLSRLSPPEKTPRLASVSSSSSPVCFTFCLFSLSRSIATMYTCASVTSSLRPQRHHYLSMVPTLVATIFISVTRSTHEPVVSVDICQVFLACACFISRPFSDS